jgi:SET and MYND domain-containing protein
MNHSCVPNAAVTMDGPRVIIHALLPIPRGKEIFMAYVRTTDYRAARRNLLYERYRFWCNCTKCTTEAAIGGDHELPWHLEMSVADAEQCLQQIKNQPLASPSSSSPLSSLSSLTPPSSSPEAAAAAEERKARTLKVGTAWAKHVLPANHLGRAVEASKLLEEGLRFCATEHLEGTQPYWAMKDLLRTWNISNGNLQKAFALDAEVYFERLPVEYPIPNDPERVRFSWRFYTLYNTFLCDLTEPELSRLPFDHCLCLYGVAKRVADVVGKSHGDDTRFAKQVYARFDEVKSDYLRGGLVNWQKMERAFDREMNRMKVYAEKNLYDRT